MGKMTGIGMGYWAAVSASPCEAHSDIPLDIPWDWGVQGQHSHIQVPPPGCLFFICAALLPMFVPWCSCYHFVQQGLPRDCAFYSRGDSNIKIYLIFIQSAAVIHLQTEQREVQGGGLGPHSLCNAVII